MNCAVRERTCERLVDELVLLDQREASKARAVDGHVEVVAATGAVHDRDLRRVGEGLLDQVLESLSAQERLLTVRNACIPSLR